MRLIRIATTDEEIQSTYCLMKQLRPHILESDYVQIVRTQSEESGYRIVTLREDEQIVCLSGVRTSHSLAWGKYLYVDDLVTDEQQRSKGAGEAMLNWLIDYARKNQCAELHLDSGVQRHQAHRFYLRERMDIVFFHFRLKL
jgi:GNAT superfamily N-acetyltransferase